MKTTYKEFFKETFSWEKEVDRKITYYRLYFNYVGSWWNKVAMITELSFPNLTYYQVHINNSSVKSIEYKNYPTLDIAKGIAEKYASKYIKQTIQRYKRFIKENE